MKRFISFLATGSSAVLLLSGPAAAKEDASQAGESTTPVETVRTEVNGIPVIVVPPKRYVPIGSVSANKSDIPLIVTPQSVSVITRDQMDLLNFIDSQQAVRYTAGVH